MDKLTAPNGPTGHNSLAQASNERLFSEKTLPQGKLDKGLCLTKD